MIIYRGEIFLGLKACLYLVAFFFLTPQEELFANERVESKPVSETVETSAAQSGGQELLPPDDSPALLRTIQLAFPTQGNVPNVEPETYLFYMEVTDYLSRPSQDKWVPYTEETEEVIREDFLKLWDTGFLDDLWIEIVDQPWENGVIGKRIIFNLEERARVRFVTFEGSDEVDRGDIDTAMEENGIGIRVDSFLDESMIKRVKGLVQFMFADKGYQFAEINHEVTPMPGAAKTVQLTFNMDEGPKVFVDEITFAGNEAMSNGRLRGQMKNTKERYWLSWITGRGTYKEAQYEEDADRLVAFYRNEGYVDAQVGQPELEYLEITEDGENRGLRLRIPIEEGERYRVGDVKFEGNDVINAAGLRELFQDLESGEYYSEAYIRDSFETARELYGALGYYEMTLFPDLQPRTRVNSSNLDDESETTGVAEVSDGPAKVLVTHIEGAPVVDVTIQIQEGDQYFVNRITIEGNHTTHDQVIRRELQLMERGVFNTAGLRHSIRRLNQLGFFEPLDEETAVDIDKIENAENEVDLTINLTETNLNQLTFGAGVSQFDGFFGQVSFQTSNFLGRGETLGVGVQSGSRVRDINLTFTEPYLFDRNMSGQVALFSRKIEWIGAYTEDSKGGTATVGWPLSLYGRFFLSYSYEATNVQDINPYFTADPDFLSFNPFFQDALLLGSGGSRTVSKVTPMVSLNTIDHPIFPRSGSKYQAGVDFAGIGGNSRFIKPLLESIWYLPQTARTTIGVRLQYQHLFSGSVDQIPIFERLWLGGEYSIRGYDIRRIGPTLSDMDPNIPVETYQGRSIIGGNKSLLANFEYQISIADPVRIVFFYDAGQVRDFGQDFAMDAFKTSTGIELRFFIPMLNVPFRLIYAWNPQSEGIYNDRLSPQEDSVFRFAVGTTF